MNAANSSSPGVENVTLPRIPGPPPDMAVGSTAYQLLQQREAIQDLRFTLDEDIHNLVRTNWQRYRTMLRAWFGNVNSTLAELQNTGRREAAAWLENYLVISPSLSDPNNFKSMVQMGFGTQAVMFFGEDNSRSKDDWLGRDDRDLENQNRLRLPRPVQPATWGRGSTFSSTIYLRDAVAGRLWISYLPTGIAFCVRCPCVDLISPKVYLAELSKDLCRGTYEFIPRHFHTDPFEDDLALRHFSTCHGIEFPAGVVEMLETYGLRVQPIDGESLDPWFIAAHNMVATAWRAEAMSSWQAIKNSRGMPRHHWPRSYRSHRSAVTNRYIDRSLLLDTLVFSWPVPDSPNTAHNTSQWTVFCTFPDCCEPGFNKHPFHEDRAFKHFASHGLLLMKEHEVIERFGFRVRSEDTLGELSAPKRRKARTLKTLTFRERIVKYPTPALTRKCKMHGIEPAGLSRSDMLQQLTAKLQADPVIVVAPGLASGATAGDRRASYAA